MRVLHVIDACPTRAREFTRLRPAQGFDDRVLACKLVCERIPHESHICIIGPRQSEARARGLGLHAPHRMSPFLGSARGAASGMASLISAIRPDLIHWWGERFSGGCFGRPGKAWRLEMWLRVTPLGLPVWLSGGSAIVCGPEYEQEAKSAGLSVVRTGSPAFARDCKGRAESGDSLNLLLIGADADARAFRFFIGFIAVAGLSVKGIMHAEAAQRARMRRSFTREWKINDVGISSLPRSNLLSQADAAIWMGGKRCPAIAIRSALASGVPVVAPAEATRYFPASIAPYCVGLNATPVELARKLIALVSDRALLRQVGDAARESLDATVINDRFATSVADAWSTQVGRDWLDPADRPQIVSQSIAEPAA